MARLDGCPHAIDSSGANRLNYRLNLSVKLSTERHRVSSSDTTRKKPCPIASSRAHTSCRNGLTASQRKRSHCLKSDSMESRGIFAYFFPKELDMKTAFRVEELH
jgi:hypothetical protein